MSNLRRIKKAVEKSKNPRKITLTSSSKKVSLFSLYMRSADANVMVYNSAKKQLHKSDGEKPFRNKFTRLTSKKEIKDEIERLHISQIDKFIVFDRTYNILRSPLNKQQFIKFLEARLEKLEQVEK